MPSEQYSLIDLIRQWLNDNGYDFEYDDYVDFVLLYASTPTIKARPRRFTIGRGTWATNFLDQEGEKRGMMILKDKVQIAGETGGIVEIQAWDPTLFQQLKDYLS